MLAWDQLRPVVLGCVGDGEIVAADLRDRLVAADVTLSPLVFHGMLATLERTGLVAGRYAADEPEGIAPDRRRYRLTAAGAADLAGAGVTPLREAA